MTTRTDDELEALVRSTLTEHAAGAPAALTTRVDTHPRTVTPTADGTLPPGAQTPDRPAAGAQTPDRPAAGAQTPDRPDPARRPTRRGAPGARPRAAQNPDGREPQSRRRRRWAPIGAAAAAAAGILALAVGPHLGEQAVHAPGGASSPRATSSATGARAPAAAIPPLPVIPDGWRVESYGAASLAVPPTWGWGGSPGTTAFAGDLCTARFALVVPGSGEGDSTTPFVGRPFGPSVVDCPGVPYPGVDAVWFASPYAEGSESLPDGRVAETRVFGDQKITVFSADPVLRQRILDTLYPMRFTDKQGQEIGDIPDRNGCPISPPPLQAPDESTPTGLAVCVYEKDRLLWSGHRDATAAKQYVDAVRLASANFDVAACSYVPAERQVWIGVQRAGSTGWDRVDYHCGWLIVSYAALEAGGSTGLATGLAPLRAATVAPWGGEGIRAYVRGPDPQLATRAHPYFSR